MGRKRINIDELKKKTKDELIQELLKHSEEEFNFGNLPVVSSYQSEAFYELLFQSTHYGIVITDDDYNLDFVNKTYYEIFEEKESDEEVKLPESFIEFSKKNKCDTDVKNLDSFKEFSLDLGNNNIKELKIRCVHFKDKYERLKLIFQIKDITEHRRSQEEVKQSEERFRAIVESSHNGIVIVDEKRKIEYVNKRVLRLLSLKKEEILGKDTTSFIDKQDLEKALDAFQKRLNGEHVSSEYDLKLNIADGKKIIARLSATVIKFKGEIKTIIQIVDITEDVRRNKLQLVLLNISQAVNSVSNLPEFLGIVKKELSKIIDTKNFYVALYKKKSGMYHFPYYADETYETYESDELKYTLTDYVRRKNKAILVNDKVTEILVKQGEIKEAATGRYSPIWIGAPLVVNNNVVGVIALQNYFYEKAYDYNDLELLKLIAQNVSSLIWKKEIIDRLTESKLRYRDFIERSSEAIYRVDFTEPINISLPIEEQVELMLQKASIEECNESFAKMYGFDSAKELVGKKVLDFYAEEDYETVFNEHIKFVNSGYNMSDLETHEYNEKGEKLTISNNTIGIIKHGFLHNVWGIQKNITETRRIQNVIQEIAEGISSLTGDSFFNSLVKFLGKKLNIDFALIAQISADLETAEILSIVNSEEVIENFTFEIKDTPCSSIIKYNSPTKIEGILEKYPDNDFFKENKINYYLGKPLIDSEGKIIGIITLLNKEDFEDIDFTKSVLEIFASRSAAEIERKKYLLELVAAKEEAERTNNLKSDFLAQMSHEIRTPVNTILSFTSLLKDNIEDKLDEELKGSFGIIENGGRRLIRTIDLILDVSQMQAGNLKLILDTINLIKVLNDLISEFEQEAGKKNLSLTLDTELEELNVIADLYTVTQIFANLIHNSIKYTTEGGITLNAYKAETGEIFVKVIDTGVGMSEDFLTKIFEPFSQEETGYTRKFEGTGLGLTLVRNYCKLNNAKIYIESKKNEGSTFTVKFTHDDSQLSFF